MPNADDDPAIGVLAGETQKRAEVGGKSIPTPDAHKSPDNHRGEKQARKGEKR